MEAEEDGDEDMVAVGNGEEAVVEGQSGKEAAVEVGDAVEGRCRKEAASDAMEPQTEKGGDVGRRVVGKRGNSEQGQPLRTYM